MTAAPRPAGNDGVLPGTPSPSGAPDGASQVLLVDASGGERSPRCTSRPGDESEPGDKTFCRGGGLGVARPRPGGDLRRGGGTAGIRTWGWPRPGTREGPASSSGPILSPSRSAQGGGEALVRALGDHARARPGAPTGAARAPRGAGGRSQGPGPVRARRGMTPTTVSVNLVVTGAFGPTELDKVTTGRPRTRRNY